ncbi:MAG: hypothetical protein Kow00120_24510 [Anaerolineae bacterium]
MVSDNEYPANWPEIARDIKARAGWCCEHCGHPHDPATGHVLTVHHLDGDPANCDRTNLVALCQRCHLHIQAVWKPGEMLPAQWGDAPPAWIVQRGLPYLPSAQLRLFED